MRKVTVRDTTLYHVAAVELGAAEQWWRLARTNALSDPVLTGSHLLSIPDTDAQAGDGLPEWEPTDTHI